MPFHSIRKLDQVTKRSPLLKPATKLGIKKNSGIKEDEFPEKMEASYKSRAISMHPLIIQHNENVNEKTSNKFSELIPKDEPRQKRIKREIIKEENEQKRQIRLISIKLCAN